MSSPVPTTSPTRPPTTTPKTCSTSAMRPRWPGSISRTGTGGGAARSRIAAIDQEHRSRPAPNYSVRDRRRQLGDLQRRTHGTAAHFLERHAGHISRLQHAVDGERVIPETALVLVDQELKQRGRGLAA